MGTLYSLPLRQSQEVRVTPRHYYLPCRPEFHSTALARFLTGTLAYANLRVSARRYILWGKLG